MTDDTEFVSVRLPADVANWLREYATANNLIRAGKPNMGGSIISAIRERMNGIETMSNNVGHSDIEAMVQSAVTALVTEKIEPMHESIKQAIATLDSLKLSKELVDEAIATAKKPLMLSPQLKAVALQKLGQAA